MAPMEKERFWGIRLGVCSSSVLVVVSFLSEHSRTGGGIVCKKASTDGAQNGEYTAGPKSQSSD